MRAATAGMVVSGILWIVFGVFVMLDPWGAAEIYRPDLGYAVITDRALHLLYGIPGTAALVWSCKAPVGSSPTPLRTEIGMVCAGRQDRGRRLSAVLTATSAPM